MKLQNLEGLEALSKEEMVNIDGGAIDVPQILDVTGKFVSSLAGNLLGTVGIALLGTFAFLNNVLGPLFNGGK